MHSVGPNNFPFYTEAERYQPVIQGDGGQLSGDSACLLAREWVWHMIFRFCKESCEGFPCIIVSRD